MVIQLTARLVWKPQDDFSHMPDSLERMARRLGRAPPPSNCRASLHLVSPPEKIKLFDESSEFEKAKWKLPVLLKARPRTGIKSLLSSLVKTVQASPDSRAVTS